MLAVERPDVESSAQEPGRVLLEKKAVALLGLGQIAPHPLGAAALDSEADRAQERLAVVVSLDEVIARTGSQRRDRNLSVVRGGEHDDREVGIALVKPLERLETGTVRQREVEQHHVDRDGARGLDRLLQRSGRHDAHAPGARIAQEYAQQEHVARIVLDHEGRSGSLAHSLPGP